MLIKDGVIYVLMKRRCQACGFSHLVGREVGRTTIKGSAPEFFEEVQSPFYAYSMVGEKDVKFKESSGGGDYSIAKFDFILKLGSQWFLVAKKVINRTEGEPFWSNLIPHEVSIYRQKGGDRGTFIAIEGKPLEWERESVWRCKRCIEECTKKQEKRRNWRMLRVDQKIGCQNIMFDPKEKTLHCWGYETSLNNGGVTVRPNEASLILDGMRLSIGKLYLGTIRRDGNEVRVERSRPLPHF